MVKSFKIFAIFVLKLIIPTSSFDDLIFSNFKKSNYQYKIIFSNNFIAPFLYQFYFFKILLLIINKYSLYV